MIDFFEYMKKKYGISAEDVCKYDDELYKAFSWYLNWPEQHRNQLVEFLYARDSNKK